MNEKKFYLTKQKLTEIKKEYQQLLEFENHKAKSEVPRIFESEDLNLEYISFQEDLTFLKSRINELDNILKNYEIIKKPPKERQNIIGLGSRVTVDIDGEKDEFMIVGTLESNPALGKISDESPVGQALLGHKIGDKIVISSPIKTTYTIKKIKNLSV
jgi:transcription elongation factor GreA